MITKKIKYFQLHCGFLFRQNELWSEKLPTRLTCDEKNFWIHKSLSRIFQNYIYFYPLRELVCPATEEKKEVSVAANCFIPFQ